MESMLKNFRHIILHESDDSPPPSRELKITELDNFVNTEDGKAVLVDEFNSIKGGQRRSWDVGVSPENIKKNRYDELPAFDDTRVKLELSDDATDTDYINANYINGFNREKEYIATQGPLFATAKDFWAMVWQQNATKIVMLANLFEHGKPKVDKYWPDAVCTYGDIVITKLSEHPMPHINHVVRVFSLKKAGVAQPRIIRHFHFTGWPDLGVPEDRLSVVALLRQVRLYKPNSKTPIVVHCSAGVGRTGTVIMTDSMIQRAQKEGVVDFPKRLDEMRLQRVDVVEKPEQYIFAHQAVHDIFNNTDTESYLQNVEMMHRAGDYDKFSDEFKVPAQMDEVIQKLKWHNHGMSVLIHALEHGFDQSSE